jgi:hypothetical protein
MRFFDKHLPIEAELIKKYNLHSDGKFPTDRKYYCCCEITYVMDMLTHTHGYHKKSMRESLKILDKHFENPIFNKEENKKWK